MTCSRIGLYAVFGHAKLFDLWRVIQLYTIVGRAQAKFAFHAIHGLHGAFRNITPRITEKIIKITCGCPVVTLIYWGGR